MNLAIQNMNVRALKLDPESLRLLEHYHRVIGASVGAIVAVILCCTRAILDANKRDKGSVSG